MNEAVTIGDGVVLGGDVPVIIAGPCVVESRSLVEECVETLRDAAAAAGVAFVFKASFDKANRTSASSFRSIGMDEAVAILASVRETYGVPVLTDVHESWQCAPVAEAVDILQIPAFLCRQTDLLAAAAATGKPLNVKRGQFTAPEDMRHVAEKVRHFGGQLSLTERGSSHGYHNLVVDMRSLPIMRQYAPVVYDVTHSVQLPSAGDGVSGGERRFGPVLARAAAAVGVDGFFVETHPDPDAALSDGPNMVPLAAIPALLDQLVAFSTLARSLPHLAI